jgi:hypothetical protein
MKQAFLTFAQQIMQSEVIGFGSLVNVDGNFVPNR